MTRRIALQALGGASLAAASPAAPRPPLCIFSKHMAQFGYDELGRKAREIGFHGIDLTVRPKGHVLPENVTADLPRAVDAIRSHGLSVPMITTDLRKASEAAARPSLATAAKLKIPYWKPGYYRYKLPGDVEATLREVKAYTAGLAALSKDYGLAAGFHNHSGEYVGAALWDIRDILKDLDPQAIGYYFDPGHATIEGGLAGWRISLSLVAPRLKMVALKDFYWAKAADGKWKPRWCPMGEGMVEWPAVFRALRAANFTGPLTLHVEYDPKDELAAIARDYEFIRKQVDAAWSS